MNTKKATIAAASTAILFPFIVTLWLAVGMSRLAASALRVRLAFLPSWIWLRFRVDAFGFTALAFPLRLRGFGFEASASRLQHCGFILSIWLSSARISHRSFDFIASA